MEKWLNTLSNKEIRVWIKNMEYITFMHLYTDEEKKNINMAKQILLNRSN